MTDGETTLAINKIVNEKKNKMRSKEKSKDKAYQKRAAVVCEELAHGGPQGLCVWVTLLFCEFGGAVAHGRSVTTAVLSVVECGFC